MLGDWLWAAAFTATAYLIGSIPMGLMVVKLTRGRDVRETGSGSAGATNVQRLLGTRGFAAVVVLDMLKGGGVVAAAILLPLDEAVRHFNVGFSALAVVVGQCWPVLAGFRGGKGAATLAGAGLTLYYQFWWLTLPLFLLVLVLIYFVRVVSLISLFGLLLGLVIGAVFAALDMLPAPYLIGMYGGAAAMLFRHRSNIIKLVRRRERRTDMGKWKR